jgi:glycosyltransferase involved in cell wall biosynthesis
VASIRTQTFEDWELVVVGQGDESSLRDAVSLGAKDDPRVRYLHLDRPSVSAARNAGLEASTGEIVAFTDDDCEARGDWLATLDECFTPDVGFVCGAVEAPAKTHRAIGMCPTVAPDDVLFDPVHGDSWPPGFKFIGANMAVRRRCAARIGPFDECLGPPSEFVGCEDYDYVARLADLGVRMRSTPGCVVFHTYGYRYGIRAVYKLKRERMGSLGAFAAKRALLDTPAGELSVRKSMLDEARRQVATFNVKRLPNNAVRLFYHLRSYRDCLNGYDLSESARKDPVTAVLRPVTAR